MNEDTVRHGIDRAMFVREIDASDGEVVVLELDRAIHDLRKHAAESGRRLDWSSFGITFEPEVNCDGELMKGLRILRVRIFSNGVESES